jgi:hypothetical protein
MTDELLRLLGDDDLLAIFGLETSLRLLGDFFGF